MTNDELAASKNRVRALRRKSNLVLAESEALLAEQLKELVAHLSTGSPTPQQLALLPLIVDALGKIRDQQLAALWTAKLAEAIAANPRLLDQCKGAKSLHAVGNMAGRVIKAATPDRRAQAERKRLEGIAKTAGMSLDEYLKRMGNAPKKGESLLDGLGEEPTQ